MRRLRQVYRILVRAAAGWMEDGAMSMAAAIAFYTTFSLAPIMIIATSVAGLAFGAEAAQGAIADEIAEMIGPEEAKTVQTLVASARDQDSGVIASILGVLILMVGATTVFAELQTALNKIWKAAPPSGPVLGWMVKTRLKGLALVGAIGFLLIVSLVISTTLAAFSTWAGKYLPYGVGTLWTFSLITNWLVFSLLFAAVFRVLPDTRIPWRDVILGAAVTSALFLAGKFVIGFYLGSAGIATTYGAAGSLVAILLWVYYSASIFLFGAEVTRAYSENLGSRTRGGQATV